MEQRISLITLGVADVGRARAFYERLGWHGQEAEETVQGAWLVRQIFDDPAGDHDWGISAVVDLDASDEAGSAVLRITDVGQLN